MFVLKLGKLKNFINGFADFKSNVQTNPKNTENNYCI